MGNGFVYLYFSRERIEVKTTACGGVLVLENERYELKKDEVFQMNFSEGKNPRTGEKITIEDSKVPAFKEGKAFKDILK